MYLIELLILVIFYEKNFDEFFYLILLFIYNYCKRYLFEEKIKDQYYKILYQINIVFNIYMAYHLYN